MVQARNVTLMLWKQQQSTLTLVSASSMGWESQLLHSGARIRMTMLDALGVLGTKGMRSCTERVVLVHNVRRGTKTGTDSACVHASQSSFWRKAVKVAHRPVKPCHLDPSNAISHHSFTQLGIRISVKVSFNTLAEGLLSMLALTKMIILDAVTIRPKVVGHKFTARTTMTPNVMK